jgi:uncharacterized protein HemY
MASGNRQAALELARLLRKRGDLDGAEQVLREQANDGTASLELARLLRERGELDAAEQVLRASVDAGTFAAGHQLTRLLDEAGRTEEAARLRQYGLNPDGSIAGPGRAIGASD